MYFYFVAGIWAAFGGAFIKTSLRGGIQDKTAVSGWVQMLCAVIALTLQGEYTEMQIDRFVNGFPLTMYLKYFAMVTWFALYYQILKGIFYQKRVYRWLDAVIVAAIVGGVLSFIPISLAPPEMQFVLRDLLVGFRDGTYLLLAVFAFVPLTWRLAQSESVRGTQVKQFVIFAGFVIYTFVAASNVYYALVVLNNPMQNISDNGVIKGVVIACGAMLALLALPYRWGAIVFYPSRLYACWRLKRLENYVLQHIHAQDTIVLPVNPMRPAQLELEIYRMTVNILDYGRLMREDRRLYEKIEAIVAQNPEYDELVRQLTVLRR